MRPARVLYVDPPWPETQTMIPPVGPKQSRGGARKHYNLLTLEEIKKFPLPPTTPDGWLFLWTSQRRDEDGWDVLREWGYKKTGSALVWVKTQKHAEHEPVYGLGYYLRIAHEILLIGKKGKPGPPRARNLRSVILHPRGAHSEKPEIFPQTIERFSEGPYTELFARRRRKGWQSIGDQL